MAAVTTAAPLPKSLAGRALGNRSLLAGTILMAVIILAALAAPWIAPFDPNEQDVTASLGAPDATHWFGTDFFGRVLPIRGWEYGLVEGSFRAIDLSWCARVW